jgi:hypothetical protein
MALQELNKATVQKVLDQPQPVSATATYHFTVTLYEQFGRAFISWSVEPNYAIGQNDVVQLREGGAFYANWPVTGPSGAVDTGHVWGSGLNGSWWSWNYPGATGWRQLVVTPNSVE